MEEGLPAGGANDRVDGPLRITGNHYAVEARAVAGGDHEPQSDLLCSGIALDVRHNMCLVEPIALQHVIQTLNGLQHVAFRILSTKLQFCSGHELAVRGWFGNALS